MEYECLFSIMIDRSAVLQTADSETRFHHITRLFEILVMLWIPVKWNIDI